MNKNPLNINYNLPMWETPTIYSVKIDKAISVVVMTEEVLEDLSYRPDLETDGTGVSTYSNPFDYNSFDENPFAE